MSAGERMIDAEVLWTAGRREGALLSLLVAVSPCRRVGAFGRGSVMGAYLDRLNVEAAQRDKVLIRRSSDSSRVAMVRHG